MKDQHEQAWQNFLKLCLSQKTPEELSELFDFFLSIDEREDVIDRYRITTALLEGEMTQREMSKNLGVSIAKITRGSNMLKTIGQQLKVRLLQ